VNAVVAADALLLLVLKIHTSRRLLGGNRARSGEHRLKVMLLHPSDHAVLVLQAKTILK
jgi:hypothetical protein